MSYSEHARTDASTIRSTAYTPPAWWQPRGRGWRGVIHCTHLLIGLTLCLPLAIIGLTGSMLVIQPDLEPLLAPSLYRVRQLGPEHSAGEILSAARSAVPARYVATSLTGASTTGDTAVVRFATKPAGGAGPSRLEVFVDPSSLAILGVRDPTAGLFGWIRSLHSNLLVHDRRGRDVVGWLGVAMLALGLSGLTLWWPRSGRWRDGFKFRRGLNGIPFFRSLHRTVGIWGFAVFITVSFGGVCLAFPRVVAGAFATITPVRDLRGLVSSLHVIPIHGSDRIEIDRAVSLARKRVTAGRIRTIFLSARPDQPIRVMLSRSEDPDSAAIITVFIDPWRAKVIGVLDPKDYTWGERFLALQRSLHSGQGLGWPLRALVFACGFLPPFFAFTGVNIWWRRRQIRRFAPIQADIIEETS